MKNSDFLQLDIKRLGTPRDKKMTGDKSTGKKKKGKQKEVPIYQRIKRAANERYGEKSSHTGLYKDLAVKFLMGQNGTVGKGSEMKFTIDALNKADAKTFGHILEDFACIEHIQIWSIVVSQPQLDRRDKMVVVPSKLQNEYDQTKIS